ncbi:MAG: molybdopterin biosynthesis protein [Peptococcaceae bacterium]|nr:molybdopterin biosynthesis protein [Peptococcaceae bacterium]MDH7524411.1 molybdopterin biosynthesis protein [Peptococcaceae bacterium]
MRKIYLESRTRLEAKRMLLERAAFDARTERIQVHEALGRVTAGPVFARNSLPFYPVSAMDGIAVKAETTFGASDQHPLVLHEKKDYLVVDTGDLLPEGFDAVIKIEDVQTLDKESLEIIAPVAPGQHVRPVGEDVVAGEIIVPAYHLLTPPDLGAILAGGETHIEVLAKPRVIIIPTGDELVPPGSSPQKGQITEFNGTVMAAYLREWGADPVVHEIVRDRFDELRQAVEESLEKSDMVIINAGSSAGRDDYTVHVLESLGEVLVHGIAARPGKPAVLGFARGKPVLGIPGYPVSAYLALEWFARLLVCKFLHQPEPERQRIKARLGRRVVSDLGSEEFVRMTVGYVKGRYVANPLGRGAGVTMSMVRADGLLVIPGDSLGYEEGQEVEIELYRPERELKNTLVAVGSHDLALDLLATAVKRINPALRLSSSHVGSMGGIMAIKKGEAHFAGIHLFDSETGEYNLPYVRKYLAGEEVVLVNLVYRLQGWIVEKGNPLGIKDVRDIVEKKAPFINRQKGAGTRLLFDYLLRRDGLNPSDVYGYNREEYSHLNVAAAVAAGTARVGLGILSAARAYDLDFIPVGEERYDLLMSREFYESERGKALLEVVAEPAFKKEVEALGGYSMRDAGKVLYPPPAVR